MTAKIHLADVETFMNALDEFRREYRYPTSRLRPARELVAAAKPLLGMVDIAVDEKWSKVIATLEGVLATTDDELRHELTTAIDRAYFELAMGMAGLRDEPAVTEAAPNRCPYGDLEGSAH